MTIQKRLFAFLTAILLLLPLTGCLVQKNSTVPDTDPTGAVVAPDGVNTAAPADVPVFDEEAVAIELGDLQIRAKDVQNAFDQYVSYFSNGYGMDEESLGQFLRMSEEWLIESNMPEWKAKQLGLTLSAEEEAQCGADAQADVDEERNMLLCYYGDPEGLIEDASLLTEEQKSEAIETINGELSTMFGEGFTFDDYLAMRYEDILNSKHTDAFSALLEDHVSGSAVVDDAAIDAWYEKTLDEQKTQFDADPQLYLDHENGRSIDGPAICLYVPVNAAKLELIHIPADESSADRIAENTAKMTELEAEYGALKLNGEDEARQAAIETEYAALREETETLTAQQDSKPKETAALAYAALQSGTTFDDAMDLYNEHSEEESGRYVWTVFTDGSETDFPALAEAAAKMEPGAYSEPIEIDGDYYIIRLSETVSAGPVDRASIAETLQTAAVDGIRADAWQTQYDAWLEEAKNAAVYHRETYEMLISLYLG